LGCGTLLGQGTGSQSVGTQGAAVQADYPGRALDLEAFEQVWRTVRDKHWDFKPRDLKPGEKKPAGLDWQAIGNEYRPKVLTAANGEAVRALTREMLGRLHQSHFAIIGGAAGASAAREPAGEGTPGFELRVLGEHAVVTEVWRPETGVKAGWELVRADGKALEPLIHQLKEELGQTAAMSELTLERAVASLVTGATGSKRTLEFRDEMNAPVTLQAPLVEPRGSAVSFGNLTGQKVWFESKRLGRTGYFRLNMFLDLVRVMKGFGDAIVDCSQPQNACDGLVIDLRGNPGGIGAMAMGMAGFLVSKPDQRLGTMYLRDLTLKFVINPRAEAFAGPVAILVDGMSASTSEIFAGGLQDLGRARVFGGRTAAAALPSVIERLPNGDFFQYAVANYISEGGKALEGNGVTPDEEVALTREGLLAGQDAVLNRALDWIREQAGRR
jgi:carboxyl-terminal processing protease